MKISRGGYPAWLVCGDQGNQGSTQRNATQRNATGGGLDVTISSEEPATEKDQKTAADKKDEFEDRAERRDIIVSIKRLLDQQHTQSQQDKSESYSANGLHLISHRLERKKLKIDLAAVIGAYIAASLLIVQDVVLKLTMDDARSAVRIAHADNIKSLFESSAATADSNRAATAAEQSLMATQYEERAWVGAPDYRPIYGRNNKTVSFELKFRNVGKLPTGQIYINAGYSPLQRALHRVEKLLQVRYL